MPYRITTVSLLKGDIVDLFSMSLDEDALVFWHITDPCKYSVVPWEPVSPAVLNSWRQGSGNRGIMFQTIGAPLGLLANSLKTGSASAITAKLLQALCKRLGLPPKGVKVLPPFHSGPSLRDHPLSYN